MKRNNYYVINRFFLVLHIVLIVAILFCNDEKNGFLAILGYGAEKIMILGPDYKCKVCLCKNSDQHRKL